MWTETEDEVLRAAIGVHGSKRWNIVAEFVPDRSGKQCRERWLSMLNPELAHVPWTPAEDATLIRLHKDYGNHWARIAEGLPGQSRISLRNRWGSHLRHNKNLDEENISTFTHDTPAASNTIHQADIFLLEEFGDWSESSSKAFFVDLYSTWVL